MFYIEEKVQNYGNINRAYVMWKERKRNCCGHFIHICQNTNTHKDLNRKRERQKERERERGAGSDKMRINWNEFKKVWGEAEIKCTHASVIAKK